MMEGAPLQVWTALGTLLAVLRDTLSKKDGDTILAEVNRLLKNPEIWSNSGLAFPSELKWEADMRELDQIMRAKLTEIRLSDDGERQARKVKAVALLERMGEEIAAMGKAA